METSDIPKKRFPWKWPIIGIGGFLVLCLIFALVIHHRKTIWTNDAYIDGYQITISSDIEGARIITLYVDEGDFVKEGQLLCQLDESIYNSKKQDAATNVFLLEEQVKLRKIEMEKLRDIYIVASQEYNNQIISFIDFDGNRKRLPRIRSAI